MKVVTNIRLCSNVTTLSKWNRPLILAITDIILEVIGAVGVQSWQNFPKVVCKLGCLWAMKKCKETISQANVSSYTRGYPYHQPGSQNLVWFFGLLEGNKTRAVRFLAFSWSTWPTIIAHKFWQFLPELNNMPYFWHLSSPLSVLVKESRYASPTKKQCTDYVRNSIRNLSNDAYCLGAH